MNAETISHYCILEKLGDGRWMIYPRADSVHRDIMMAENSPW